MREELLRSTFGKMPGVPFQLQFLGSMALSTSLGLMIGNIANILTVRLQNVDYRLQKGVFGAIKDLFLVDRHRMVYKGLFPIMVAC